MERMATRSDRLSVGMMANGRVPFGASSVHRESVHLVLIGRAERLLGLEIADSDFDFT